MRIRKIQKWGDRSKKIRNLKKHFRNKDRTRKSKRANKPSNAWRETEREKENSINQN